MDLFGVLWLSVVAFSAFWQAAWGWKALRSGVATYYFHYEIRRDEKPFHFWMLVAGRGAGLAVAAWLFVLGFRMFKDMSV